MITRRPTIPQRKPIWTCLKKVERDFLDFAKEHAHDREDQRATVAGSG